LLNKIRRHPQIKEQITGMLEEVEDERGELRTADEVEEALVRRVRELGRLGVEGWAQKKAAQADQRQAGQGGRRSGKKK
jgi:hypothetical protein